jgi:hypothetical protein
MPPDRPENRRIAVEVERVSVSVTRWSSDQPSASSIFDWTLASASVST